MPKPKLDTQSNRKVTDFFTKLSKSPKARPDRVAQKSLSPEKQATISISSDDDMPSSSLNSHRTQNSKGTPRPKPNLRRSTPARPVLKQSCDSETTLSSHEASPGPTPVSQKPNSKSKKTVYVISAEDSDDDDESPLPVIVLPSALTSMDDPPIVTPKARKLGRPSPLTPRQNLILFSESNMTLTKSSFTSSPKLSVTKSASKPNIEKRPSPPKRPRYHSPERKPSITAESDADDEHEQEGKTPSTPCSQSKESINEVTLETMETDNIEAPTLTAPLVPFQSIPTTPVSKNVIIPSSQHGEMEVDQLELGPLSTSDEGVPKPTAKLDHLNPSATPGLSPCSARTLAIINQIKAKAETDAAQEAEKIKNRMSLGLTDDESDLSSLSDSSDLSLDLGSFRKSNGQTLQPPVKPKLEDPPTQDVRRSARNQDVPAPNYKIKLSLVRQDSSPTPIPSRSSKTSQRCPLDKIMKESATLKASAEANRQASRATSVDYASETSYSRFLSGDDAHPDSPSLDNNITEDPAREAVLGKEASDAVGKILQDDLKKRKEEKSTRVESFSVWDDSAMVTEDTLPILHMGNASPLIASLKEALNGYDYEKAALLISSGTLFSGSQPSGLSELLSWLFKLAFTTQSQQLSMSAYRAFVSLEPGRFPAGLLTEELSHWVIQRIGLKDTVLKVLNINKSYGKLEDSTSKISALSCLLTLLSKTARSQALTETLIPSLTTALLVLGMDSLIFSSLRCTMVSTIEAILSEQKFSRETELLVCKAVREVIVKLAFTFEDQARLLELLSGCSSVSGRIRRWIAWSMLGGDLDTIQEYGDFPFFTTVLDLFSKDTPGKVKMVVHSEVDYKVFGAQTDILSVIMTDIEGYAGQPGGKDFIEGVFRHLDKLLGKIFDTRAAHLDRSKTKDAINRLRNRLQYQLDAAMQVLRPRKDKLHHFFPEKKKSKPTATGVNL